MNALFTGVYQFLSVCLSLCLGLSLSYTHTHIVLVLLVSVLLVLHCINTSVDAALRIVPSRYMWTSLRDGNRPTCQS
jgi:hypothetical protein